jgi:DNA-binding transcriptional MocR family regulator
VAIETPTYFGLLEALESLHLKALEIATHPRDGICLDELGEAIRNDNIAACVLVPTFGNPLGHCMPEPAKRRLVRLLAAAGIPLIEDDVYADLAFSGPRPPAAKAFDETGNVLLCSSFSKTLAPGYRIGWTAPGRYRREVERLKYSTSVATATPTQMAVASFLESGGFDRHLRRMRRTYRDLLGRMSAAVAEHFPEGTRLTRPEGGHVLWVEMPPGVDSLELHEAALDQGVSIAPGPLFSATQRYRNFLRLNCAVPWTDAVEGAVRRLGKLVAARS